MTCILTPFWLSALSDFALYTSHSLPLPHLTRTLKLSFLCKISFVLYITGDQVLNGARPKPFMVYRNMDMLDVHPIQSVVKVDDTVSGVGEALEAGCWGVGVARYSNYMDIDSFEHEDKLSPEEIERRVEISRDLLRKTGAHYVVDSIADLPEVIADINKRLAAGEKP